MNEKRIPKALAWYFHPNEIVRLLRFRQLTPIDPKSDLTPRYGNDIKVGVVLGTYGAAPYIDLQLHYLKNVNGIDNILIHDDCSSDTEGKKLIELSKKYGVNFYSTERNLFHKANVGTIGDQSCFLEGLKWAKAKGLDILVKLSRRLIPCFNWIDSFKSLVKESDGLTFSSFCKTDRFPIRTEAIGMNVNAWTNKYTLDQLEFYVKNEYMLFSEFWFSEMAKQIEYQNFSSKFKDYRDAHFTGALYSGYVHWTELLGEDRRSKDGRNPNTLWHLYSSPQEYFNKAQEVFPNKYTLNDFQNVVNI